MKKINYMKIIFNVAEIKICDFLKKDFPDKGNTCFLDERG